MKTHTLHASCLCGTIRWEVDGPLPRPDPGTTDPLALLTMSHCHCSRCRKAHGAPYATYLIAPEKAFRITQGKDHIVRWRSSQAMFRPFCDTCGSVVPDGSAWNGIVAVPVGNFDEDPGLRALSHIFVGSKAPWVEIHDDLPRFDTAPEGLGMPGMETRAPLDPDTGEPRGSCLCGGVTYVVTAPPLRSRTCHCSRCRKASSAACMSAVMTPRDGVRFTRGEDLLGSYKVPEAKFFTNVFCRTCGSPMPRRVRERDIVVVPMGSLDDDPGVRPSAHIFVGSKAAWDVISDDLPQLQEM
jgi:hypothetical protein